MMRSTSPARRISASVGAPFAGAGSFAGAAGAGDPVGAGGGGGAEIVGGCCTSGSFIVPFVSLVHTRDRLSRPSADQRNRRGARRPLSPGAVGRLNGIRYSRIFPVTGGF
jgi:hypothetical protein